MYTDLGGFVAYPLLGLEQEGASTLLTLVVAQVSSVSNMERHAC